jgi:hypothetical protein
VTSVLRLFNGLMVSSLDTFVKPPLMNCSGRVSDDCDECRAFWAEPRIPSRLKLVLCALLPDGDLSMGPLGFALSWGEGISIEKLSLVATGNVLPPLVAASTEMGESPVEEGDMLCCPSLQW